MACSDLPPSYQKIHFDLINMPNCPECNCSAGSECTSDKYETRCRVRRVRLLLTPHLQLSLQDRRMQTLSPRTVVYLETPCDLCSYVG